MHSIRLAATENLRRLADLFGAEWTQAHVLPEVEKLHEAAVYQEVGRRRRRAGGGGKGGAGPTAHKISDIPASQPPPTKPITYHSA